MDNQRQQYNQNQRNERNRGGYQHQDRGEQRQYDRRGPPQRYDNRNNENSEYRGGGGGYGRNGGGGGRGGNYGGGYDRNAGGGGYRGGRGGYRGRGGSGYEGDNNRNEYKNNGGQYDRKRPNDSEYEQRPAKRQYEKPKPDPTPIDFEFEGTVGGQNVRFLYKNKEQVPAQLTAIHTIRIYGRLDNTLPFANQTELVIFLGNCGNFLKQGASFMDKTLSTTVSLNNQDVSAKMKTITLALFNTCELIEFDSKKLNLLQLPAFVRIPELKVVIEPESLLDIESSSIKDATDAQYVVRITCPSPPFDEFKYYSGKKSEMKLVKEMDIKGGASFLLFKYAVGQPKPAKLRNREAYPKLPQISITNAPMQQPGSGK